jgi:hypothetical protein
VEAAPLSGAASPSPPTVRLRPFVRPALWPNEPGGYAQDHPYVRRFWTAVLGPGAVADLLRLITAARRERPLRRPLHLAQLAREGLVLFEADGLYVRSRVPPLSVRHLRRLPARLRAEHRLECWQPLNGLG